MIHINCTRLTLAALVHLKSHAALVKSPKLQKLLGQLVLFDTSQAVCAPAGSRPKIDKQTRKTQNRHRIGIVVTVEPGRSINRGYSKDKLYLSTKFP